MRYVEKIITGQKKINDTSQQTNGTTQETINPLAGLIQTLPGGIPQPQQMTWTGFWESYKSAVHENESISKIDMFNYLRSLLEGISSRAIKGLALPSSNYDSAVEILEQRFKRLQHKNFRAHGRAP